ncbi:serine/threonine-protein kinase [Lentzea sp. JNUCC 0626]|uniref:serine/threonine-protein kinase n=1 Tax=Lentzea sp. JNUCC 0626 TaxID=3367513 RepID=UPI003749C294
MPTDSDLLADRYRLGDLLGEGGFAEVRRARDVLLARDVAVKLFRPGDGRVDARRIDAEICALAGLSHRGLVKVFDADPGGETPYVVLELVEGSTLRERITDGPMSVDEVRRIGSALADALAHVHERGFVHRDVKPANILLDDDNLPRLTDFGLARAADIAGVTKTGQVVGTAAYLAPEQVRGQAITSAVDVYALGLVLLECLTGRREYEGADLESAVARLHRPPAIPDDLPFDLVLLLTRMTSPSVARRPSARECASALPKPTGDAPTVVVPVPRRPLRSRALLGVASAVVLCSAIGMGLSTWHSVTSTGSEPPATTAPGTTQPQVAPVVVQPAAQIDTPSPVQVVDQGRPVNHEKKSADRSGPGKGPKENKGKQGEKKP